MNDFVAIYLKEENVAVLQSVLDIVKKEYSILDLWQSPSHNFTLLNILNNYSNIESGERNNSLCSRISFIRKRYRFLYSGYITRQADEFSSTIKFLNGSLYAEPSRGIASFSLYDEFSKKVFFWSTLPPIRPLFYCENKDLIVVGTRPKIVHLCSRRSLKVKLSDNYILSVLADGYSLEDTTPFNETYICPIRKSLVIQNNKVFFEQYPVLPYEDLSDADFKTKVDLLCNQLINSVEPLKNYQNPEFWLSGGKDSRLVAATMKAAGIDIHCVNKSFPTLVDIEGSKASVAYSVADTLNFPFKVIQPRFNVQGNLSKSVQHSLTLADYFINPATLLIAQEVIPFVNNSESVTVGHAELQKGGFARKMERKKKAIAAKAFSKFNSYSCYLQNSIVNKQLDIISNYLSNFNVGHFLEILYWLHFDFDCKYYMVQYLQLSKSRLPVYPLMDEKVCRILSSINMYDKVFEKVMFASIKTMTPEIANIPLYQWRWKFEQGGICSDFEDGYELRSPAFPNSKLIQKFFELHPNSEREPELNFSGNLGKTIFSKISNSSIAYLLKESLKKDVYQAICEHDCEFIDNFNNEHKVSKFLGGNFLWLLYSLAVLYDELD